MGSVGEHYEDLLAQRYTWMVRLLADSAYPRLVEGYETGVDGERYEWDTSIAP